MVLIVAFSLFIEKATFSKEGEDKKVDLAKSQAYMGDPAHKRGFELGYDDGVRTGKKDQKEGKKQNPGASESYKTADKKYRYEYGSRARFVSGYQSGFTKGYKSGYAREQEITKGKQGGTETTEIKPVKKKVRITPPPTTSSLPPPPPTERVNDGDAGDGY